jgi:hypothetical protein
MLDLIERLVEHARDIRHKDQSTSDVCKEAAREIAELRQVIIRIKAEAQEQYELGQDSILHPF